MNAQELHLANGKPTGIFFCEACRTVKVTKNEADACCAPLKCECGAGRKLYHTKCPACEQADWRAQETKKEADRFAAAEKVQEDHHDGWVYAEGIGHQDGYFHSVGDLRDYCEDNEDLPEYVWACTEKQFVRVGLDDVITVFEDEAYEDFSSDDLSGLPELEVALTVFMERNKDVVVQLPNFKKAVILTK